MAINPSRFQFTIARLMGATMLVALAAWVGTSNMVTVKIKGGVAGPEGWNLFPIIVWIVLLGAAAGLLLHGKEGPFVLVDGRGRPALRFLPAGVVREGANAGCMLLFMGVWITGVLVTIIQLFSFFTWLWRPG
jgi:hypothetical protein